MNDQVKNGFWHFSLAFYDDPEVQGAFLNLQDKFDADVNVVLFLLYVARLGQSVSFSSIAAIDRQVSAWRTEIVQPLRAIRRKLKDAALGIDGSTQENFRSKVKKLELHSEKIEQDYLSSIRLSEMTTMQPTDAARRNLTEYAAFIGADPEQPSLELLLRRFSNEDR